jgi:hypothetical protein
MKERYNSHKRTFTSPYFFELRYVVETDDPKKAEEIFGNFPDIKDNIQQLKIGSSVQRETFLMPETLTEGKLYHLMRKACRQSASVDVLMSDAHDNMLEIEREKTKQLGLKLDHDAKIARLDHKYRMAQLKRMNQSTPPIVPMGTESGAAPIKQTKPVVNQAPAPTPKSETPKLLDLFTKQHLPLFCRQL